MAYVDPSVTAETIRERQVLAAIRRRGLSLHRLHRDGRAVRVTGPGVYVTACNLGSVSLSDLAPVEPNRN
ncbi:hypothetical protein [Ideonella sp. A 288]|uniref:hypothetical protein n=1 Tax=Ideonella sp. A 288 TaxID=1962181 RepID=UPI001185F745|nr:hypothetical protein [Ideonella sp. A 288]